MANSATRATCMQPPLDQTRVRERATRYARDDPPLSPSRRIQRTPSWVDDRAWLACTTSFRVRLRVSALHRRQARAVAPATDLGMSRVKLVTHWTWLALALPIFITPHAEAATYDVMA